MAFKKLATCRSSTLTSLRHFSSSLAGAVQKIGAELYLPREPKDAPLLPILCGWVGSNQKTLCKYATIYNELGLPVVCATPGVIPMLFNGSAVRFATNLFRAVSNNVDEPTGIILHLFSGSSYILPSQNFPSNLSLKTIIFDSGPPPYRYSTLRNAMKQLVSCNRINHFTYSIVMSCGIIINSAYAQRKRDIDAQTRRSKTLHVPQLYLHSDTDAVTPSVYVAEIINEQSSLGRSVDQVKWNDSEHVQHLMKYPDEYCTSIHLFLDKYGICHT